MSNGTVDTGAIVRAITEIVKQLQNLNKKLDMIHTILANPPQK
jgi:hypothetical protein